MNRAVEDGFRQLKHEWQKDVQEELDASKKRDGNVSEVRDPVQPTLLDYGLHKTGGTLMDRKHPFYKKYWNKTVKALVSTGSSFRMVENREYRELMRYVNPDAPNLSGKSMSKCVKKAASHILESLRCSDLSSTGVPNPEK